MVTSSINWSNSASSADYPGSSLMDWTLIMDTKPLKIETQDSWVAWHFGWLSGIGIHSGWVLQLGNLACNSGSHLSIKNTIHQYQIPSPLVDQVQ